MNNINSDNNDNANNNDNKELIREGVFTAEKASDKARQ